MWKAEESTNHDCTAANMGAQGQRYRGKNKPSILFESQSMLTEVAYVFLLHRH